MQAAAAAAAAAGVNQRVIATIAPDDFCLAWV